MGCWGERGGERGEGGCILTALISSRSAARWDSNEEEEEEDGFCETLEEGAVRVDMVLGSGRELDEVQRVIKRRVGVWKWMQQEGGLRGNRS